METPSAVRDGEVELVTFYVGELLLGAEIQYVEEINRHTDLTPVAHAHESVRGVMNLRGEVVTVLDLRSILGLGRTETTKNTRNVIVNTGGESIGLLVDRIADVVNAQWSEVKAAAGQSDGRRRAVSPRRLRTGPRTAGRPRYCRGARDGQRRILMYSSRSA